MTAIQTDPNKEVSFQSETCGYCGLELTGIARWEGHKNCVSKYKQELASKLAQQGIIELDEKEDSL
jgi:hypothetical protein